MRQYGLATAWLLVNLSCEILPSVIDSLISLTIPQNSITTITITPLRTSLRLLNLYSGKETNLMRQKRITDGQLVGKRIGETRANQVFNLNHRDIQKQQKLVIWSRNLSTSKVS